MVEIEFKDDFDAFDKIVEKSVLELCAKITSQAKVLCPVDKGNLRKGNYYETKRFDGYVKNDVYYGPYVEFGTRYQKPQPFMRQAILLYTSNKGVQEVKEWADREVKIWDKTVKAKKRVFK